MSSSAEDGGAHADQEDATLEVLRARLHRDFDAVVSPAEVERALRAALSRFDGSPIRTFIPILVERLVVEELRSAAPARDRGPTSTDEPTE